MKKWNEIEITNVCSGCESAVSLVPLFPSHGPDFAAVAHSVYLSLCMGHAVITDADEEAREGTMDGS